MKRSPIISAEDLLKIYNHENLIIVDAGSGGKSRENYNAKHLKNALYVDLNDDLAELPEDEKFGGRHPLPSLENFAKVLQKLGIDENSYIIIYDDKNASNAAARFWWMLKSIGFENIQVLDGGLQQGEKSGIEITSEITQSKKVNLLKLEAWELPLIMMNEIDEFSKKSENLLIDVRDKERYDGKIEPIYSIAGHIPNAKNLPFKNNVEENGQFKKPEILKEYFLNIFNGINSGNIAVHCGSGVTACHTLLAMNYAGLEIPKLYVGSWSEWIRNNKNIETEL